MPREAVLATTLVALADTLVDDFDVVELLTGLTDGCIDVLGVGAAGLMLVTPEGDLRVMASSSEAMRVLELADVATIAVDLERAFATLRNHARNHNRRLADLARDITDGTLTASTLHPPPPPDSTA